MPQRGSRTVWYGESSAIAYRPMACPVRHTNQRFTLGVDRVRHAAMGIGRAMGNIFPPHAMPQRGSRTVGAWRRAVTVWGNHPRSPIARWRARFPHNQSLTLGVARARHAAMGIGCAMGNIFPPHAMPQRGSRTVWGIIRDRLSPDGVPGSQYQSAIHSWGRPGTPCGVGYLARYGQHFSAARHAPTWVTHGMGNPPRSPIARWRAQFAIPINH